MLEEAAFCLRDGADGEMTGPARGPAREGGESEAQSFRGAGGDGGGGRGQRRAAGGQEGRRLEGQRDRSAGCMDSGAERPSQPAEPAGQEVNEALPKAPGGAVGLPAAQLTPAG